MPISGASKRAADVDAHWRVRPSAASPCITGMASFQIGANGLAHVNFSPLFFCLGTIIFNPDRRYGAAIRQQNFHSPVKTAADLPRNLES
ncbi:MAG: hypothetical protein ABWZ75_11610 [Novosphingobium sp.]